MHHLAEELSDLPTPPPARLQSRLLRWRSEDRGKERWKGVVDVLRVQSQVMEDLKNGCSFPSGTFGIDGHLCPRVP